MNTTTKPGQAKVQDQEFATNACEVSIFMAGFGLVNELKTINAALHRGEMSREVFGHKFKSLLHQLCFVAESTARFDIVLPVLRYGQFSPFFWRWFNWWNEYLVTLTPTQIWSLQEAVRARNTNHPRIRAMRPKGDWLTYHATSPFTVVNT